MKCEACRHISPASLGHTKDNSTTDRPLRLQVGEAAAGVLSSPDRCYGKWLELVLDNTIWAGLLLEVEVIKRAQKPFQIKDRLL